ncbi:MAG: acyltransferase family protein [Lachnospiraceae bacterium]|nr:acyltransferase family protein [Lachnospiraceae bacterium]
MNSQKITKELSQRINIYKLILTFMVVYIHAYSSSNSNNISEISPWLENFKYIISQAISKSSVPAFFFLSAFFLYRKDFSWKENVKQKFKTLGISYLLLNFIWIIFFFVAQELPYTRNFFISSGKIIKDYNFIDFSNAFLGFKNTFSPFLYTLWFVRDLLFLNILSKIIWKFIDKIPNLMLIITVILWLTIESTGIFCLDIQAICFWILGGIIVKKNIKLDIADKIPFLLLTLIYVFSITVDLLSRDMQIHMSIHRFNVIIGIIFWFSLTKFLINGNLKQYLLNLSAYNFSIYLFHEFTLRFAKKICAKILPASTISQFLQYFFLPIAVIAFCVILSICLKKILPKFYSLLTGGRT